tara:strand:- start:240 stop:599 length:360 start_codon:yes stop_codon:yes gene_type:complete
MTKLVYYNQVKQLNKREIIKKFVSAPKKSTRAFWSKEMKMLNDLLEIFPNRTFWTKANMPKIDSLVMLKSGYGLKILKKKYKEFHYKVPQKTTIAIGEKTGEDKILSKKPKTIREFIDE